MVVFLPNIEREKALSHYHWPQKGLRYRGIFIIFTCITYNDSVTMEKSERKRSLSDKQHWKHQGVKPQKAVTEFEWTSSVNTFLKLVCKFILTGCWQHWFFWGGSISKNTHSTATVQPPTLINLQALRQQRVFNICSKLWTCPVRPQRGNCYLSLGVYLNATGQNLLNGAVKCFYNLFLCLN